MSIALTKKELSNIAGYTYQRLHTIDQGLPRDKKLFVKSEADGKKFDLALFVQRWVEYNKAAAEEESEELSVIKAKHEAVKMEKTQLEVSRMRGEYVSITALAPVWSQIAAEVADRFNNLAAKLAPTLVMIADAEIIEAAIEREVRDAQSLLTSMPLYDETSRDDEAEDTDQ